MLPKLKTQTNIEYDCCRLLRTDRSSRLILPLARRGRPFPSSRSHHVLCKNCSNIKRKQQREILQREQKNSSNIFDTINDLNRTSEPNISHEIEFSLTDQNEKIHLNQSEYEPEQMLIWKIKPSNRQTTILNDTGSLNDNEKKVLLLEAVRKLQIVLNNRSTSTTTITIPESDLDQIEFTYRALQTTVNILSSSLDSL
ncbi:hypothetical protein I4U23_007323 [Adineta vaga]|nr:hypothetical protein I4U23_007323 [Adineta vaga]